MTALDALLERWANAGDHVTGYGGLEYPRVYRHSLDEADGWCVVYSEFWHGYRIDPGRLADHAHVLAATIEAIEARWKQVSWFILHHAKEESPERRIRASVQYFQADTANSWPYNGADGPTPIVALLTAYLNALEAAQGNP